MNTFIYGLIDPRPEINHIRYIGKSNHPDIRFKRHLKDSTLKRTYKELWINKLLNNGFKPLLVIVEECAENVWKDREIYWIDYYRNLYENKLTNTSPGGMGGITWINEHPLKGVKRSEESKEKQRIKMTGPGSPNWGSKRTEDIKKKMSNAQKGERGSMYGKKPWNYGLEATDEHKRKLSESHRGKILSEEHKKNISEGNKGNIHSDLTKKKLSERAKKREKITCPHCDKIGQNSVMKRWHFENCKNKI